MVVQSSVSGGKYDGPAGPTRERPVVTSVRVEEPGFSHDHIHIWNRGGKAGTLVVDKGDGLVIARRLFAGEVFVEREGGEAE